MQSVWHLSERPEQPSVTLVYPATVATDYIPPACLLWESSELIVLKWAGWVIHALVESDYEVVRLRRWFTQVVCYVAVESACVYLLYMRVHKNLLLPKSCLAT